MKVPRYTFVRLALCACVLTATAVCLQAQVGDATTRPAAAAATDVERGGGGGGWVGQVFGPAMWLLWACSIALLAAIVNRARAMRRAQVVDRQMVEGVAQAMGALDTERAIDRARQSSTLVGQAWARGLREYKLGGVPLNTALTDASAVALKPLRQHLWLITTIGVIAPMFGLIGTVVGMIITFSTLAETGGADKAKLAVGLSFALYKTAGGLIVAIPAIAFGRYFASKVMQYAEEVEAAIQHVCYEHSHGLAADRPHAAGPAATTTRALETAGVE